MTASLFDLVEANEERAPVPSTADHVGPEALLRMVVTEAERALGAGRRLEAIEFLRDARTLLQRESRLAFPELRGRARAAWKEVRS